MVSKEEILDPINIDDKVKDKRLVGKWGKIKYFFHIDRNCDYKRGDNLISVSFFMLHEIDDVYAYQKGVTKEEFIKEHKRKVKMYLDGLKKLISLSKRQSINYTIRIYCDISTIKYLKRYLTEMNVELYYYFFPQFFVDSHHVGFFGTLIRYLPLFKLEHHNFGEWETTTILDIDLQFKNEYKLMRYYINRIKLGHKIPNLMFKNRACYFVDPRVSSMHMHPQFFTIISSFFVQHNPQSFSIFKYFLEDLLKDKFYNYNRVLNLYLGDKKEGRLMRGRLEYGVDEYFLNKIFFQKYYLDKNRSFMEVFVGNHQLNGVTSWLYNLQKTNKKIENERLLEQFLKVLVALTMPNYYIKPYENVHELIDNIGDDMFKMGIYKKKVSDDKFEKIIEIVRKITPQKLEMPKDMLICLERSMKLPSDKNTIIIIKPKHTYPKYEENVMDYVKF